MHAPVGKLMCHGRQKAFIQDTQLSLLVFCRGQISYQNPQTVQRLLLTKNRINIQIQTLMMVSVNLQRLRTETSRFMDKNHETAHYINHLKLVL